MSAHSVCRNIKSSLAPQEGFDGATLTQPSANFFLWRLILVPLFSVLSSSYGRTVESTQLMSEPREDREERRVKL